MADDGLVTIHHCSAITDAKKNPFSIKVGLTQKLKGGAILEVTNSEQAKLAESAGACCIIVSESFQRGFSHMSGPSLIKEIKRAVSIPLMAKSQVGHFVEAQILEAIGVDYIDENEDIDIADQDNYINKHNFRAPFLCDGRDLGEALSRVREGAAMIRTGKDLFGSRDIVGTVRNVRSIMGEIRNITNMEEDELFSFSKKIEAPYDLVAQTKQMGRFPVLYFAAGGIVTPADAALMMQLGCDGVFLGSEIFDCADPYKRVPAFVQAVRHYNDPRVLADAMAGLNFSEDRDKQVGSEDGQNS